MAWIWTTLSIVLFLYILQKLFARKKNVPPGPVGLPIIGHFHLLRKNAHQDLYHLARKHGSIMYLRLGFRPTIIVSSPAAAELFLKTHDLIFASRPAMQVADYVAYGQRNLILSPYGQYWRNMRKLVTLELFSMRKINQFRDMRRAEIELFVLSLKQLADARQVADLTLKLSNLTRDMNSLMIFGQKFTDGEFNEKGFKEVLTELLEISGKFNLTDYFPYIDWLDLQGLKAQMKQKTEIFDEFLEKILDDHVKNKSKKQNEDFVDSLMAILETGEAGFQFDRRHVKAVLLDIFIAGTDTTSTTMEWAISELVRHPQVMKKLQNELESVVGLDHMVEESHLEELEYLNFVVKETLRLHPTAPLLVPHESTEDCMVNGFHIPKHSQILVNAWAIGRDPNAWSNPHSFLPERFSESNIDVKGQDFQLIPFGSGRRMCAGIQLGLKVVKLVLAQLIHCFNWELPNGMMPSDLDMSERLRIVAGRDKHLMVIPTYRLSI